MKTKKLSAAVEKFATYFDKRKLRDKPLSEPMPKSTFPPGIEDKPSEQISLDKLVEMMEREKSKRYEDQKHRADDIDSKSEETEEEKVERVLRELGLLD